MAKIQRTEFPWKAFSGKMTKSSKTVMVAYRDGAFGSVREYVKPRITDAARLQGAKVKAAATLWAQVHENFKNDLQIYAHAFNSKFRSRELRRVDVSPYNIWMKALVTHTQPFTALTGPSGVKSLLGENISDWMITNVIPNIPDLNVANADISNG